MARTERLTFRVEAKHRSLLEAAAKSEGVTISDFIRYAVATATRVTLADEILERDLEFGSDPELHEVVDG